MSRKAKSEPSSVPLSEAFEQAFSLVQSLAKSFEAKAHFLSSMFREASMKLLK